MQHVLCEEGIKLINISRFYSSSKQIDTGTSPPPSSSVFSCQYLSKNSQCPYLSTRCSYQKDKRTRPGNLPKKQCNFGNSWGRGGGQCLKSNFTVSPRQYDSNLQTRLIIYLHQDGLADWLTDRLLPREFDTSSPTYSQIQQRLVDLTTEIGANYRYIGIWRILDNGQSSSK